MELRNRKILIVSPHPDDEVIGCGGLIAKALSNGAKVFVLYMAVGKCRQLVTGGTDEDTRIKEIKSVAAAGGFGYKIQFVGDEFMRLDSLPQKTLIDAFEDIISEQKPDIVCLPCHYSFDQDHRAVFNAGMTAVRPIPQKVRHLVPVVLEYEEPYSWTVEAVFKPNFFIPLSKDELDKKIKLLKLHATQMREQPHSRSVENIRRLAGIRGADIGVDAAEAYSLHRIVAK